MNGNRPYLEFRAVSKHFSKVQVLHEVNLSLQKGEIHALIGENGAGKSTLMKILGGYQPPSSGHIMLEGREITLRSSREAEHLGIVLLHQEFNQAEDLSIAENLYLGHELRRGFLLDNAAMNAGASGALEQVGLQLDPRTKVRDLIVPHRQMVEIAKALLRDASVLILDEPTATLTPQEREKLFDVMHTLKSKGVTMLYISHKLDEVQRMCDRVTVLRDGRVVVTKSADRMTLHQMANLMVGRELSEMYPPKAERTADKDNDLKGSDLKDRDAQVRIPMFTTHQVSVPGWVDDVSFELYRGEVLGFAGLVGAGRTELLEGIFGLRKRSSGHFTRDGKPIELRNPRDAARVGMVYLSEDRKGKGLHLEFGLRSNLTLMALEKYAHPLLNIGAEQRALEGAIVDYGIRTGDSNVKAVSLSGGNQQKLAIAKLMQLEPDILVLDEPTRGVDVGAKREIYLLMRRLTAEGKAVIMISSELPELLGMADRVVVMRAGRIMGLLEGEQLNEQDIIAYATGLRGHPVQARRPPNTPSTQA